MQLSAPNGMPIDPDARPAEPLEEVAPKRASKEILRHEIAEGLDALDRPAVGLFVSGLSAGLDIGFGLFLMAVMLTQVEGKLATPIGALLVAAMSSVGFIFVVLGRSELFTEQTTLAVLPVLDGRSTLGRLLRLWGIVYVANLLGGAIFAGMVTWIGPRLGVIEPRIFGEIARKLTRHPADAIFLSGLLAGWLMGLLSWLVAAGRDTISQILLVALITSAIGFAKLHHAILGTVEVLAGVFSGQGVDMADYGRFLLWSTLGNTVGGVVFVAFLKYGQARPAAQNVPHEASRSSSQKG